MGAAKHIIWVIILCSATVSLWGQRPTTKIIVRDGKKVVVALDTMQMDSTLRDSLRRAGGDSALLNGMKLKPGTLSEKDNLKKPFKPRTHFSLTLDTIKPGPLVALSLIPGMGQIYNRQWWKVPIFYVTLGGFTTGGIAFGNQARAATLKWQNAVNAGQAPEIVNPLRERMMNAKTASTVMYALAGATYFYQLADATFNYRGKTNHIRKATTLAALFPGAGFIYTRTYWRLPIYYGGFAALGTVIDYNNRSYTRFKTAWELVIDGNPETIDEFNGRFSADVLKNAKDSYRRNRDFGIICLAGAYILSIVDTYVIATLKNWDVSPDLAMSVTPTLFNERLGQNNTIPSGAGLSLCFKF